MTNSKEGRMLERLTEWMNDDLGGVWVKNHDYVTAAQRLAYYEDLEEQGRLITLPCKVGDTVWVDARTLPYNYLHPADGCKDFARYKVVSVVNTKAGTDLKLLALYPSRAGRRDYLRYSVGAICKTVFLTREAAEKALEEGADHE